ncbi:hypothetical protein [uncultured Lamprocystis sp.]|jgi:hypothetical protein|uniref:hypothetical protein n=1 Tax=uncultured Lamprocystis sp. TaxID=543132 RepID=UPI0025D96D7D|nr:hypothetical protein [uncultured Lamprocystis sp.]
MQLEIDLDRPHHERLRQLQDRLQQPLDIVIARLVDLGYALSAKDSALETIPALNTVRDLDGDTPDEDQAWAQLLGDPIVPNSIRSLSWSEAEVLDTRLRLRSFADDWNDVGMDAYNEL